MFQHSLTNFLSKRLGPTNQGILGRDLWRSTCAFFLKKPVNLGKGLNLNVLQWAQQAVWQKETIPNYMELFLSSYSHIRSQWNAMLNII